MKDNLKNLLQIKNMTSTSADLYFYGDIVSDWWGAWQDEDQYPDSIKNFLSEADGVDLNIHINSGGGSVFAGIAIYNMLKQYKGKKTVYIDGLAGSIASVIALVGDEVIMGTGSMMMIHKPWGYCAGNADDMRKYAECLDSIQESIISIYSEKLIEGVEVETVNSLVNAETWLTATETSKYFDVTIETTIEAAACISDNFKFYKNTPENIIRKDNDEKKEAKLKEELLMQIGLL